MKFNINKYQDSENYKFAMHCKTLEEAINFCAYLHSKGRLWISNESYISRCNWNLYKENTLYYFNQGVYGLIDNAHKENAIVLEWCDYMNKKFTKDNLKTGDVVKFENGQIGLVFKEFNATAIKEGCLFIGYLKNDLISDNENFTITQVRRPRSMEDCIFETFANEYGELIYDKNEEIEEKVEMTMEEICAALGKNIKIVKK